MLQCAKQPRSVPIDAAGVWALSRLDSHHEDAEGPCTSRWILGAHRDDGVRLEYLGVDFLESSRQFCASRVRLGIDDVRRCERQC